MSILTIKDFPNDLRKRLALSAIQQGCTIRDVIIAVLESELDSEEELQEFKGVRP